MGSPTRFLGVHWKLVSVDEDTLISSGRSIARLKIHNDAVDSYHALHRKLFALFLAQPREPFSRLRAMATESSDNR